MAYITSGTFNHALVTMCFLVATLYGLNFYYEGHDQGAIIEEKLSKETKPNGFWDSVLTSGTDWIMSILSIASPWILIKGFFFYTLYDNSYSTYQALDLFIMRPIGWVILFMESEWIINKLRGISG